ncbi:ATP-binding cassette sub-family C member 9-like [Asterias rubens]|uniref:ATP-binding cassette sub-family C member 9-like n=1 Tax=Asterias rubens TaxID=7604 RepID=UPI0014556623|nr:ATP-binding cassette sub-family C member 9-like [Asterias rubens]
MDPEWEWFCGINSSYTNESLDWYHNVRNNTCLVNGVGSISHGIFIILFSLILLVVGCCTKYRQVNTKHLLVYPGHSIRWLISALLSVILLASIGEGVMTDETYQVLNQPTQPHLYVHSVLSFIAVLVSLIYYHHMELWQIPIMSPLLFLYWLSSLGHEIFRVLSLEYQNQDDVNIVLFDLTVIKIVIYFFLMIIELNVIRTEFCCCCQQPKHFPSDLRRDEMKYMHYNVSFFSSLTFWWANWLLTLGYKKHLELSDLGVPPKRHEAKFNHERFRKAFKEEMKKTNITGGEVSLPKIYVKVYGRRLFCAAILKLVGEMIAFINPLAIGALTSYVTTLKYPNEGPPEVNPKHHVTMEEFFKNGFVLVVVMFLASVVNFICLQTHFYIAIIEGLNVRAAIQAMVYEKSLRLSTVATTGGTMDMGQITNHMSVDPTAIYFMFQMVNNLWAVPIQLAVNLALLYYQMGYSALIGASLFILMSPVQLKIASFIGRQQKNLLKCSDERLKKTNELLQGIKLLKLYAWEGLYCKAIEIIRAKELNFLLKINIGFISTVCLTLSMPVLVTIVGYGTYTALTGDPLTPAVTFSSLALFNALLVPLMNLPMSLLYFINGYVSTKRVQKFLAAPEVEKHGSELSREQNGARRDQAESVGFRKPDSETFTDSSSESSDEIDTVETSKLMKKNGGNDVSKGASILRYGSTCTGREVQNESTTRLKHGVSIKISNGCFLWDPESSHAVLSDINVEIPEGKLTILTGQVGSGKSSFISAILGEMTTITGMVQVRDRNQIAFAAQKPWLLNTSLQENILFSQPVESRKYKRVIDACALRPDIDILPAGDQTEIGEKGINLSGGQKQRISVARTMYSDRDVIILDDPLSALDVHVGRHLFEEGIMKLLVSHRQTVILVTHQLQYLNRADLIIEMKDGRIAAQGTLDDIIAADPDMYSEYNKAVELASESEAELEQSGYESESVKEERLRLQQQVKTAILKKDGDKSRASGTLMEKEEMERGSVSYSVYLYYAINAGWLTFILGVILAAVNSGFLIGTNFWLSAWSEAGLRNQTDNDELFAQYFGVYVGLNAGYLIFRVLTAAAIVWGVLTAAKRLQRGMLHNIIKVPLRFFDTTPIGRVLNRFSNDTEQIDTKLLQTINLLLASSLKVLSAVLVNAIVMPIFIAFFIPIAIGYFFLQRYFLATSRELQRLDSVSKSPVFAYFSESLGGLTTIRAFRCGDRFYKTVISRINSNLSAFMYLQVVQRWLGVRLDFIGALMVILAGMTTLVGALTIGLDPSLVGLAVTYTLQISGYLNFYVRTMADLEMQMNAVERVKYYTHVDNESYEGLEPPQNWPNCGTVKLENVSVRYGQETDPVLRDITVEFQAGEKVGICGRTGAGKSSLTLALLRVIDICKGRVVIDGIDIKSVPLTSLRSQISIIPQDPVLFTGTIRYNLDPTGKDNTDESLWRALEIAQLKDAVSSLDEGLDSMVSEGGENFSVGQRQLFCLARAFLRKSRILIMDEATASIDLETDKLLQRVVTTAFAERTVLTIAHRIGTILNSDKILVLDDGKVAEYGAPNELIEKEDGIFASFVRDKDM